MEDKVMKRLMVILAIVCSSAHIFASELVVKGKIDVPFSVFINGEKYYSYNNKVNIGYLPSGRYGMEIYTEGSSYELLYDYSIDIPKHATVYATFTGDNKMYISTKKDGPATVVIDLTPYPHRLYVPAPRPVVYHSTPKPAPHHHHHVAPAPKPAPHHAKPAPKPDNHKAAPAPKKDSRPAPKNDSKSETKHYGPRNTVHTR
ncbi:MAG: hypothetical protein J6X18_16050 [Bacteroidales bacterium]|nr:hypothetical protein [Bacteroidales bacterium]